MKKVEICISGMATSSRHSLPTQQKVERRRKHNLIIISLKTDVTNNYISTNNLPW
jgi:hypothetical protein